MISAPGRARARTDYQYTLWSYDEKLYDWIPKAIAVCAVPGVVDVSSDCEQGGLLNATINRDTASRLNVSISDIDTALENAFSQRQFSTIYGIEPV